MSNEDELLQTALDHHRDGRLKEAAEFYLQVLDLRPGHTDALYLLGVVAHQIGNHDYAVELLRQVLAGAPDDIRCFNVLGLALMALGRDDEAEATFQRAISAGNAPEAYNNLGSLRRNQGRLDDAISAFRKAVEQAPEYANAHYNLGNAYRATKDLKLAAECFRRAVEIDPGHANALAGLGQVLATTGLAKEAIPFLEKALALLPADAVLHCDLADAWQTLGDLDQAAAEYRSAIECDPNLSRAWFAAGCAQSSQSEFATAIASFRKAVETDPEWQQARHNLAQALFKMGQVEEAMPLFRQAAVGEHAEVAMGAIATLIPGDPGSDKQAILDARRAWAERALPPPRPAARFAGRGPLNGRRLRVGYVSSFFQDRNWMKPVWGLIKQHDRERFQVHLFSDAPATAIQDGCGVHADDRFHDISGLSNEAAADTIEEAGIDLLVDLNGYSALPRLGLFALRPAPVIVAWFNLYATSGMSSYDYLIADEVAVPLAEAGFYCEKIAHVPGSYLTFEVAYPVPDVATPPCLVKRAITFGCLAPQYKITGNVVAAWSSILQQVPQSSMILKNTALGSIGNRQFVLEKFAAHGIPAARLRLEGSSEHYQFLQTYDQIDIALDTFPYNGGTTTMEALWQGVPIITFWGDRQVSRTSASILRAGGLGELVAQGVDDYTSTAIRLATSPGAFDSLAELRRDMRSRLLQSPVCDARSFARNMEQLYLQFAATHHS